MDSEFIPHDYIDNLEKRNIIMKILDTKLSEVQRISTILFYYEEKSIKDISSILECSEGTVKSRLSSSRRIIKSEIEKIENKGIKLHCIAGIPVLSLILQETAKNTIISQEISKEIFKTIANNLESLGVISASAIGVTHSGFIAKIIGLIKNSTVAKIATSVVILVVISTTIVFPFVFNSSVDSAEDVKTGELVTTDKSEKEEKTEGDNIIDSELGKDAEGAKVEVAHKISDPSDTSTKNTITAEQQQQTGTPVEPTPTPTPAPVEPPEPVAPSIETGYNADMTNKLMGMFSRPNTNNSDIYSLYNSCTPEYLAQFKSIAPGYLSSGSDPSSLKSFRGEHTFKDPGMTSRTFYTVVDSFNYGEVTGNDANSIHDKMLASPNGCLAISCSYNGSTYVARYVSAGTGCTED